MTATMSVWARIICEPLLNQHACIVLNKAGQSATCTIADNALLTQLMYTFLSNNAYFDCALWNSERLESHSEINLLDCSISKAPSSLTIIFKSLSTLTQSPQVKEKEKLC